MRSKALYTLLLCQFIGYSTDMSGQGQIEARPTFESATQNLLLINPAVDMPVSKGRTSLFYQSNVGAFSQVRSFGLHGILHHARHNAAYFELYNEQEGPFFSRFRIYAGYATNVRLNDALRLTGGLSLGWVHYQMKSSTGGTGGSDGKPDINFGLRLESERFHIGLSMMQLNSAKIRPIDFIFKIQRHYEITSGYLLKITPSVETLVMGRFRFSSGNFREFYLYSFSRIHEKILAGINFFSNGRMAFIGGYKLVTDGNFSPEFLLSYSFPTAYQIRIQRIEFTVLLGVGGG